MKPFIRFSSYVKIRVIRLIDSLNSLWDPFEEFTRWADRKSEQTLAAKEALFSTKLLTFLDGNIFQYMRPTNTGDQALWQGMTTAMLAMKYGETREASDLTNLKIALKGMDEHQTIHGEGSRRLIRGWRWLDNGGTPNTSSAQLFLTTNVEGRVALVEDWASNDSAAGHVLGIFFAYLHGDAEARISAATLARGLADELLAHNFAIVDSNGAATPFGALLNGMLTDPLRLATCLTILQVAAYATQDPKYSAAYEEVRKEYGAGGLANYAKVKLWWWDTDPDTHRATFLLHILTFLETDQSVKAGYEDGLKRIWALERKTGNPWVGYLVGQMAGISGTDQDVIKMVLSEITVEDKEVQLQKINSRRSDIEIFNWPPTNWLLRKLNATAHPRTRQPLPIWQRGAQDFLWQRNLHAVDDWVGVLSGGASYNGVDFLVAYWLGRHIGYIRAEE